MEDLFYIVPIGDNWYNLRLKDSHYVLGCGSDLDRLLKTLRGLIKRYRTPAKLLSAVENFEDRGKVNDLTLAVYQGQYEALGNVMSDVVKKCVRDALEEVKFDTPFHRNRKKHKLNKVNHSSEVIEEKTEEDNPVLIVKSVKKFRRSR